MIANKRHTSSPKLNILLLHALLLASGVWMSMPCFAEDAGRIAANYAENWNQSLRYGDVDEVMALYSGLSSTVIAPDGQIAGSNSEIEAFWHRHLKANKFRTHFKLLNAHFNQHAGQGQKSVIIARYLVNADDRNTSPLNSGQPSQWRLDAILKQEASGQWKTQLQLWH